MSEPEAKTAIGTCAEISERGEWTTFHVDVGSQYPVKLSTKLAALVELGRAASKSGGVFEWSYSESQGKENPHKPGTYYMNRYLSGVEPAAEGAQTAPNATGGSAAAPGQGGAQMTKEEWARKDSAIHKMACIKSAAAALTHTIPNEPTPEDLGRFISNVLYVALPLHRSVIAERDDPAGEDVPF